MAESLFKLIEGNHGQSKQVILLPIGPFHTKGDDVIGGVIGKIFVRDFGKLPVPNDYQILNGIANHYSVRVSSVSSAGTFMQLNSTGTQTRAGNQAARSVGK